MPHCALDSDGFVTAIHNGGGRNPLEPPPGGSVATITEAVYQQIIDGDFRAGSRVRIGEPVSDVQPKARAMRGMAIATPEQVKELRAEKMKQIGNEAVKARDRVYDAFPHVHMGGQHRHIDVIVTRLRKLERLLIAKRIISESEIDAPMVTRHLKTGEFEAVTMTAVLDEIEATLPVRQEIRNLDQSYRDKINAPYMDATKVPDEKLALIEAVAVPEFLDVDEKKSTAEKLLTKNGAANGK